MDKKELGKNTTKYLNRGDLFKMIGRTVREITDFNRNETLSIENL